MKNLIIADNFYRNPDRIREFALSCEWVDKKKLAKDFPGTESRQCHYSIGVIDKISEMVGFRVKPEPRKHAFGAFALTLKQDNQTRKVHVDGCEWTGILYLTPNTLAQGGTTLYKHRHTRLTKLPAEENLAALGYASLEEFKRDIISRDGADNNQWEVDSFIEMRFNRLVLFRGGQLFHAPDFYFGEKPESGRLVQLFFFNEE